MKELEKKYRVTYDRRPNLTLARIENIGTLRIYHTKKGDTYDYSQIPAHFRQQVMDTVEPLSKDRVLGIDEAGKGDFFGPIVAAAAYVKDPAMARALGVRDSKTLTDEKIIALSEKIKKHCPVFVVKMNPERYNSMYENMKNLNTVLAWMHARAIENALEEVEPDYAISDRFANPKVLQSSLKAKGRGIRLVQETKAEKYMSVAAASVVARAEFVLGLQQLSFKYGMELGLGASDNIIGQAKEFVKKFGRDELHMVAKMNFRTASLI